MSAQRTGVADVECVREALHRVIEPELGINVVDLDMIRDIERDGARPSSTWCFTTMKCPFWGSFVDHVKMALVDVDGVGEVDVRFGPRPRWTPELLSESARWELKI